MNYGELKTAVSDWIDHDDSDYTIPLFIEMARSEINRLLRVREMSCSATALGDGEKVDFDLPLDWGGARQITVGPTPSQFLTPDHFDFFQAGKCGPLQVHTIEGNKLRLAPVVGDGTTVTMLYYRKVPQLVEDTDTNWLLTEHPDCWLAGAVHQAQGFVTDDARMVSWHGKMMSAIDQIIKMDRRDRWSGGTLRIRSA